MNHWYKNLSSIYTKTLRPRQSEINYKSIRIDHGNINELKKKCFHWFCSWEAICLGVGKLRSVMLVNEIF